uniref:Uncharacterized protein n=1 Tax=uncultured marine group II/III euryarchaeote KM3_168_D03 TaxID=1457920 RepID=A0A075GHW2_9EURY|nr:hypothetical protein [uncultured marine group II/III euryarchaeote KM3_168_D03]
MPLGRSMARKLLFFLTAIILLQLVPISQGQNIIPEVEIQCDQPAPIDVYPGATRTTIIYCSIQNSNPYNVKVEITYQGGVLVIAGPASVTVGAGSEITFQAAVRGELRQSVGSQVVSITSQVTEASGAPVSAITQPEEVKLLVVINQFSRLRVEAAESLVTMGIGNEIDLDFWVYNDGNGRDQFNLEISNKEYLEESGWSVLSPMSSVEIDSLSAPEKVRITLIAPPRISSNNFTVLGNGSHQQVFNLEFKVTSEFSISNEGIANYQIAETSIKLIEPNDSLIARSLAFPNTIFSIFAICSAALFFNYSRFNTKSPTVATPNLHR